MSSARVCILLMDSLGIGESLDASQYGDAGANTFAHIFQQCEAGHADKPGLRRGPLHVPNLTKYGLIHATIASSGLKLLDLSSIPEPAGYYGYAVEQSLGKDTPSGHWEIAGVPVKFEWGYFPETVPCFPSELMDKLIQRAGLPGVLGQKHASELKSLKNWAMST